MHFRSLILFAMAAIAIGGLCYFYKVGPFRPPLSRERFLEVREIIRTTPSAVIVFGDSIVQAAPLPLTICGTPIVNAGVGGAGIRYFARYANELLGSSAPKLIVLSVGINDAHEETLPFFRSSYQTTVTALTHRAPVLLATIAPVEPGTLTLMEAVPSLNETIKDMAGPLKIIDLNEQMTGERLTTDGIHLNAEGYALWTKAMMGGIAKALGCST